MKRKNASRNALISSIISLLLCVSMLVGATFAWFTDEVKSGMNTISAGNLDIELLADGIEVDSSTKLFDDVDGKEIVWEPGVVAYENLEVANKGTLALKYQMTLNFGNENDLNGHKLSEVLKVAVLDQPIAAGTTRTEVLADAKAAVAKDQGKGTLSNFYLTGAIDVDDDNDDDNAAVTIVIFWDPNDDAVDNLYNVNNSQVTSDGEPLHIEFGINLQATQDVYEKDSFGEDYDQFSAILPKATVNDVSADYPAVMATAGIGGSASEISMDFALQFLPNEGQEEAEASGYRYWHADYVIKADRDIEANSMALAGYYKAWCQYNNDNWVALTADTDIAANTEIRLVELLGATVNYEDICNFGNDGIGFLCGATDLTGANAGTTITVELRMYETTKAPDATGGTANEEVGPEAYEVVGKYTYTFGSKTADGLKAALAAGADEIKLDEDIELHDDPLIITDDVVIDLNGHTISGISTSSSSSNLIKVDAGAEVTLKGNGTITFGATTPDTNWGGEGQPPYPGYSNNTINNSGTLIIDGVTIKNVTAPGGASYAIDCYQGSELIVNSGVIDGCGKIAIRMFCNSNTQSTNVTINGGTITGRRAIWVQLPGSSITNVRPVNLTINGGKLICTDPDNDLCIYSYSYGDSFEDTKVTINGGEFIGTVAFGGGNAKTTQEKVTITGGTFHDGVGRYLADNGWEDISVPTP